MNKKSDQAHLLLMQETIVRFEQSPFSLETLLSVTRSLEELLNVLVDVDQDWKELFRTQWWELELTSSLMMDEEREDFTEEDKQSVSLALKNMKEMIKKNLC